MAAGETPRALVQLFEGCLAASPTEQAVVEVAAAVGAKPWSDAVAKRQLGEKPAVVVPDPSAPSRAMRNRWTVTVFRGWDFPDASSGGVEYMQSDWKTDFIDQATKQPIGIEQHTRHSSCRFSAEATNARAVFESYETLHDRRYGVLLSTDGYRVTVFAFDRSAFDVELSFTLEKPLKAVAANAKPGMNRVVLADASARYMNSVPPGVPIVNLTRAELLAGLETSARIRFSNTVIDPIAAPEAESGSPANAQVGS